MKTKKTRRKALNRPIRRSGTVQIYFNVFAIDGNFNDPYTIEEQVLNDIQLHFGEKFYLESITYMGQGGDDVATFYMEWEGSPRAVERLCEFFTKSKKWPIESIHRVQEFEV